MISFCNFMLTLVMTSYLLILNVGRMLAVVCDVPIMQPALTQQVGEDSCSKKMLFKTGLSSRMNAPQSTKFEF